MLLRVVSFVSLLAATFVISSSVLDSIHVPLKHTSRLYIVQRQLTAEELPPTAPPTHKPTVKPTFLPTDALYEQPPCPNVNCSFAKAEWACKTGRKKINGQRQRSVKRGAAISNNNSFSQYGEEAAIIRHFFPYKQHGVFVEIGGYDGVTYSNTVLLEMALNWRGLLIEGHPKSFTRLQKTRPCQTTLHTAICEKSKHMFIPFTIAESSSAGDPQTMTDVFKERIHQNQVNETVDVPCQPMSAILKVQKIKHVDVFFLDVEGAELNVLRTINFKAVEIDLFVIETAPGCHTKCGGAQKVKNDMIDEMMFGKGYEKCLDFTVPQSAVYRRKESLIKVC